MLAEHDADGPVPDKVHEPLGVKVTIPVGVVGVTALLVTVAVHDVACPTNTVEGVHDTVVVVGSIATAIVALPELAACVVSAG